MIEVRGGLGLAGERIARGPATLITHTPHHVALRTPSRPDFCAGNALHLHEPPAELGRWFADAERLIGVLAGIRELRVAWEVPGAPTPGVEVVGDRARTLTKVWRLEDGPSDTAATMPPDLDLGPVGGDDHRLAGARTLLLQGGWGKDVAAQRWRVEQDAEVARSGRGDIWVGYRFGIPVVRLGLFHDQYGLAVLDSLVVHPLYRRQGLGTAAAALAIEVLRRQHGEHTIVATTHLDSPMPKLLTSVGFTPTSHIIETTQPRI